jgi:uncharacterized small protein (DUF1192 family)
MHDDDDRPRRPPRGLAPGAPLATASVGELEAYIAALEAEIARVRAEIERRGAHHAAAEALFKRRGGPEEG